MSGGYTQTASGLVLPSSVRESLPPSDEFDNVKIFARNGFVIFERPTADGRDTQIRHANINGAETRYKKVGQYLVQCQQSSVARLRDKARSIERFLDRLKVAIKNAKEQGPFEYEDMRRAKVRSMAKSVRMPSKVE